MITLTAMATVLLAGWAVRAAWIAAARFFAPLPAEDFTGPASTLAR